MLQAIVLALVYKGGAEHLSGVTTTFSSLVI